MVPRAFTAAFAFHVSALIASRFPANTAEVPKRLFEAALTFEHPFSRIGFHALPPTRRENRRKQPLDPVHINKFLRAFSDTICSL